MGKVDSLYLPEKNACYGKSIIKLVTVIDMLSIDEIYYDLRDLTIGKRMYYYIVPQAR